MFLSSVQTDTQMKSKHIFPFKFNKIPLIYNMNDDQSFTLYTRICFYKGARLIQTYKKRN